MRIFNSYLNKYLENIKEWTEKLSMSEETLKTLVAMGQSPKKYIGATNARIVGRKGK